MPALFLFLFKVNIALVLFCLGYYLALRHLTFYTLNRIYLVAAIIFSTLYPNINLSDFAQRHQQLTEPVQTVILNWKVPAEKLVKPLYQPSYWQWMEVIFWAGVILFAARLIFQLFSMYKLYRQSKPGQMHNHEVRLVKDDISPFSFWRSIYINPSKLSPSELKNVLKHEQVHVSEWHTLDILLSELSTIFYWFNPGVWLMKKAVRENIEFITDRKILQRGIDSKEYQYSLVSVSLAAQSNTLVSHFNMSTIKKRIIMMNAKRSSGYKLTRYIFLVSAVIALLLIFSLSKAEISKKGMHTIATVISRVTNTNINTSLAPTVARSTSGKAAMNSADTIYAGKGVLAKNISVISNGDAPTIASSADGSGASVSTSESTAVASGTNVNANVVVTTTPKMATKVTTVKHVYVNATPKTVVSINKGELISPEVTENIDVKPALDDVKTKVYYIKSHNNDKITIDNDEITLDNPNVLFILDGKEVKEMKNISPVDIKSIAILKGEAAQKQYGEKGKNGVIAITTKKEK